jgi:uncharacterized protein (DUF433 family)
MQKTLDSHIAIDPARCGGKPCVAGSRVRVWDIHVWNELCGRSPEEIVADFPQLSLVDVHAALAYYWDNREAVERQMAEVEDVVAQIKSKTGPGPLARKLRAAGGREGDPVPS